MDVFESMEQLLVQLNVDLIERVQLGVLLEVAFRDLKIIILTYFQVQNFDVKVKVFEAK